MILVKTTENIKESADSGYRGNITKSLFWSFLLNHSYLKATISQVHRSICAITIMTFSSIGLAVHKGHTRHKFGFVYVEDVTILR